VCDMSKLITTTEIERPVYNLSGEKIEVIKLPSVFTTPVRKDLIKRAFLAIRSARLQPKGADPKAGERTTAESWGVGHGMARVPRVKGTSRAGLVPSTVGGRQAHPPVSYKILIERINKKEKRLATMSAIAATAIKEFVKLRGHKVDNLESLPVIVSDEFEDIERTSELKKVLKDLGLWDDILRAQKGIRVRSGRGKMRGRKYKKPKSVLIVVSSEDKNVIKAARNLPGVDVVSARILNVEHLAPGGHIGRLTLYSKSALKVLSERFKR